MNNSNHPLLDAKRRRLRELQVQQARYGIDAPAHITIEIEDLQREIAKLSGSIGATALPRPSQADFVHPYPLQANFTGRLDERKLLTEWFSYGTQPVLALIAIGGMGKSALTWTWVQKDILCHPLPGTTDDPPEIAAVYRIPDEAKPEGILWWSFYETQASFAAFLDEAIGYASDRILNLSDITSSYDKIRVLLSLLQQRRLLLVLDGFERELRAYAHLGAAYASDPVDKVSPRKNRACTDPQVGRFLRDAATLPLKSRILLTSRLFPYELENLAGCQRKDLTALDPQDAVNFFRLQGIRGTRAEIQTVCESYGYHPLALRLLAGVVKKNHRVRNDIKIASQYPILSEEEGNALNHVLQSAYNELANPERTLLSHLAAFRSPMGYDALAIFNMYDNNQLFDAALQDLEDRGMLSFNPELMRYDLHPVVRSYAYDRLYDKTMIHSRLRDYFAALPVPSEYEILNISQLSPVIELYHHTVRSGQYDAAWGVYSNRLRHPFYYQFCDYEQDIQLLLSIPTNEVGIPNLSSSTAQIWNLLYLGMSYERTGQLRSGIDAVGKAVQIARKAGEQRDLAASLVPFSMLHCDAGYLLAATKAASESTQIFDRIGDQNWKGISHRCLGRILTIQAQTDDAIEEFKKVELEYRDDPIFSHGRSILVSYKALSSLWLGEPRKALQLADIARDLAQSGQLRREEICATWIIGLSWVVLAELGEDHKQHCLTEAEIHLNRAIVECRRSHLVEFEPDILLSWARWHYLQNNFVRAHIDAEEALLITDRCGYRLKQADIHNFLAQLALDEGKRDEACHHAEVAKERAWCDGVPHCFKPALDKAERLLREIGES